MFKATKGNQLPEVQRILKLGVSPNGRSQSPEWNQKSVLHVAAQFGHEQICELLLRHDAIVDTTDETKWTPLHWAAFEGHEKVCELLIQHGANYDSIEICGNSPLHLAASKNCREVCKLLLRRGAKADAKNYFQGTPLHTAAEGGHGVP